MNEWKRLSHDRKRLLTFPESLQLAFTQIERQLPTASSIAIIGSSARGTVDRDIDVLWIGEPTYLYVPGERVHALPYSPADWQEAVTDRIELVYHVMRGGVVLRDDGTFERAEAALLQTLPDPCHQLQLANDLLSGSCTKYELRSALQAIARARIIEAGEFPRTSPELLSQVDSIDHRLSHDLQRSEKHLSYWAMRRIRKRYQKLRSF